MYCSMLFGDNMEINIVIFPKKPYPTDMILWENEFEFSETKRSNYMLFIFFVNHGFSEK